VFDLDIKVDILADQAKLDGRRPLGATKHAFSLLLEFFHNNLDEFVAAEPTAFQLVLDHALSSTIDEDAPCLYALAREDFLDDEFGSDLLALVQDRVDSGPSGIDDSEQNALAKPFGRFGIMEGVMNRGFTLSNEDQARFVVGLWK